VQQQYNADPAAIARQVNAQPVFENGRMTGVRLNGGPDSTLIAQLGLQPNDIVTSINNVPLDSPGRVQQVIDSVQNSTRVTVTINRDGKPTTLSVNVK
jgi:general secretion pathway protein C